MSTHAEANWKRCGKHGEGRRGKKTVEYRAWIHMRGRCNTKTDHRYEYYGGRGISVCSRWDDYENFLADMGRRPDGYSLDRIDVNGNYEPGNCRWASEITQKNNTRRNVNIEHNGETKSMRRWAIELGFSPDLIKKRYYRGDRGEHLFRPVDHKYHNGRPAKHEVAQ